MCVTPKSDKLEKRSLILEAALELFVAQGFSGTSMDDIAVRARVARQTIYNHFSGKDVLFRALAGSLADRLTGPLPDEASCSDLRSTLIDLAMRTRTLFLEPSSLALHRLLICDAPHFPELAKEVYEVGPRQSVIRLAEFLRQRLAGPLTVEETTRAAEQFFGMVMGQSHLRALLGIGEAGPPARTIAEKAVDQFLKSWHAG